MEGKLLKEIITSTIERFGENGSIKEKVTEVRERIYERNLSNQEASQAEVVEEKTNNREVKEVEKSKEDLIAEAASAINMIEPAKPEEVVQQNPQEPLPTTQNPYGITPPEGYVPVAGGPAPRYNVINRQVNSATFPWESNQ